MGKGQKEGIWKYPRPWQTFLYMDAKSDILSRWRTWYRRRLESNACTPLVTADLSPSTELLDFLGGDISNIALIHIKTNIMNATAAVTDPATYLPAIKYLQSEGYKIVFVGREKMPNEFYDKNILNYSESTIASFLHDLQLFSVATFSITGGSGIAWMADCLRKPVVYLNSWHLFMPPAGDTCVFVPALVQNKHTGAFLTFRQQYELYLHTSAAQGDRFPAERYVPVHASAEEILNATKELEILLRHDTSLSSVQKQFSELLPNTWLEFAQSRISESFVLRHQDLLQ